MTSPQARKGSTFERDVVSFLAGHGFPYAERHYGAGRPADVGDIDGIPGWTLECKNHRALELSAWMTEAECERVNGRQSFAAVVAKRRNKPVAQSYVVMSLGTFARLLADDEVN
jgi:Holliday junction resolvase